MECFIQFGRADNRLSAILFSFQGTTFCLSVIAVVQALYGDLRGPLGGQVYYGLPTLSIRFSIFCALRTDEICDRVRDVCTAFVASAHDYPFPLCGLPDPLAGATNMFPGGTDRLILCYTRFDSQGYFPCPPKAIWVQHRSNARA